MYEKRALSKGQFAESGIDTSDYRFIETEGTFMATLDLKVWGNRMLKNFLTLEDGRRIIACTFHRENYLGMADIPLGSVLELTFQKAAKSGQVYIRKVKANAYQCYSSVRTGSYESRKKKGLPLDGICQSPMIPEWRLQMMANLIFRKYLSEKEKVLALANSILEAHIGDTEEEENTQALLEAKQAELARLQKKMDAYIEMRAEGDLSREMFRMKCAELEPKMQKLQKEIDKLSAESKPKEVVDYTEKLTVLQYALEQYTHRDEGQDVPECVVEAFVTRIVVSRDGFDWYLRFDGGPDKPLHCQLDGKRKQTTKIMVSGEISPTMDNSDTGRYQNWGGLSYISSFPSVTRKQRSIGRPLVSTFAHPSGKI